MVRFLDRDRLPGMIAALRPLLGRSLDNHVEQAYDEMISQWERGNDAMGRSWEPLAPSTIRQKGHDTPLIETRQMIDSADYEVDRGNVQAQITIETEYAGLHEFGAPDLGIPARPILRPTMELVNKNMNSVVRQAVDRSVQMGGMGGVSADMSFGGGDDITGIGP